MDAPKDGTTFIEEARRAGLPDTTILLLLTDRGWSERRARAELAAYYERTLGLTAPVLKDRASNPLDGFLYVLSSGTLISWVVAVLETARVIIDDRFPAPDASSLGAWEIATVTWSGANILVTAPLYLVLMKILHGRLRAGVTPWNSPIRLWVLSGTLLIGVATIIGYVITAIAQLLGGESAAGSLAKSGVALVVVGALVVYYLLWLRRSGKEGPA